MSWCSYIITTDAILLQDEAEEIVSALKGLNFPVVDYIHVVLEGDCKWYAEADVKDFSSRDLKADFRILTVVKLCGITALTTF